MIIKNRKNKFIMFGRVLSYSVILINIFVAHDILNTSDLIYCTGGENDDCNLSSKPKIIKYNVKNTGNKRNFGFLKESSTKAKNIPFREDHTFQNFTFNEGEDNVFVHKDLSVETTFNFDPIENKFTLTHKKDQTVTVWEEENFLRRDEKHSQAEMGMYIRSKLDNIQHWETEANSRINYENYNRKTNSGPLLPGLQLSKIPNVYASGIKINNNPIQNIETSPIAPTTLDASPRLIDTTYLTQYEAQQKVDERNKLIESKLLEREIVDYPVEIPNSLTLEEAAKIPAKRIERQHILDKNSRKENICFYDQNVYDYEEGLNALEKAKRKLYVTIERRNLKPANYDITQALLELPSVPSTTCYSQVSHANETSYNIDKESQNNIINNKNKYNNNKFEENSHMNVFETEMTLTKEKVVPKKLVSNIKTQMQNIIKNIKDKNNNIKETMKLLDNPKILDINPKDKEALSIDLPQNQLNIIKPDIQPITLDENKDIPFVIVPHENKNIDESLLNHNNTLRRINHTSLLDLPQKASATDLQAPIVESSTIVKDTYKQSPENVDNPFKSYFNIVNKLKQEHQVRCELLDEIRKELIDSPNDPSILEIKQNLKNITEINNVLAEQTKKISDDAKNRILISEKRDTEIDELKSKFESFFTYYTKTVNEIIQTIRNILDVVTKNVSSFVKMIAISAVAAIAITAFIQVGGIGLITNGITKSLGLFIKITKWTFQSTTKTIIKSTPNIENVIKNISKLLTPTKSVDIGKSLNPFSSGAFELPKIPKELFKSLLKIFKK